MDFEQIGRDHLRLGADFAPGHRGRSTGDRCRARTISSQTIGCGIGVALLDSNVLGLDADLARQIYAKVVAWPWPWLIVPSRAIALPVGSRDCPRSTPT